jgi:hypothetical protein
MFFDYASRGAQQGRENRNRQRRELAQAFQQFQASNPEATVQDFQSFIDSMAGNGLGSNYIRGGAPSQDVLQSLAEQGQARKQQRLLEQTSANFRRRAEDLSTLEAMADRAVLGMSGDDFDGAYNTFVQSLGPNGQQIVNGMNLRNRFTIQNRDTLMGRRLMESMPQIDNYLNMYGYNTEALDPDQMSRFFGLPANQMQPFIEAANRKIQMSMQEWRQTNNSNLMQIARDAATTLGPEGVEPALRNYLQNSPFGEQMLEGFDFAPYVTEAERLVSEREEQNQIESQGRVNRMIDAWESNARLQRFLRDGDNDSALQQMYDIAARNLSDEDFQRLYGKTKEEVSSNPALAFQSDLDRYVGSERDAQEENYATRSQELDATLAEVSRTYVTNNQGRLTEVLGNYFSEQVAGTLGMQLGQRYAYSPELANAVFEINSGMDEETREAAQDNPAVAVSYILEQLQSRGFTPNIEQTRDQFIEQQREQNGLYQPQTFDDWFNSETDSVTTAMNGYRERFNQMLEAYGNNPSVLASELMKLKTVVDSVPALVEQEMAARARSERTWLYYNSGGWDQARVQQGIIDPANNGAAELSRVIEQAITQANERANETPEPVPSNQTVDAPSEDQSSISRSVSESVEEVYGVGNEIRSSVNMRPAGAVGWITSPLHAGLRWLSEEGVMNEADAQGVQDRRAWVEPRFDRLQEYGRNLKNMNPQLYAQMLVDFQNMTAEQLSQKYDPVLDALANDRQIRLPQ